ncbi:isochorismate synthase [Gracilimonas mengyeensis]|uniref:Isochorismate synthase MenF n=1 Tax=Gracilimonas mengyeensis TaxID=1302730 RepID=A0A521AN79_9BACT|nr:isochorismate synthase [Gracilimonas mengyeensis]SMO36100.1 isochorismate synthase [Gracilimonas mengyeensis]
MDSENPVLNNVKECFRQQISQIELKDAIDIVANQPVNKYHYLSVSIRIPKVDVLAVLEQHAPQKTFRYYWEKPSDEFAIAAGGQVERIQTTGDQRFREASTEGKKLLEKVHHLTKVQHHMASVHLLGGFSFFDHNIGQNWRDYGAGSFTLPEWLIINNGDLSLLTVTQKVKSGDRASDIYEQFVETINQLHEICSVEGYKIQKRPLFNSKVDTPGANSPAFKNWKESVENATELIKNEAFKKIVLARELKVQLQESVSDTHILNYLRSQYPDCYSFLVSQNGKSSFIGSTPERLASFKERHVLTEGLAGSISRGKTASEDAVLEHQLLHSHKDLSEHAFVLDAIGEHLEQYSEVYEYPEKPGIKKLSNVQHLYTPVHARIKKGVSRTEVLSRLHPTPAVGGYPREEAMPYISKLEHFDRGWYAAPIGWINTSGEGEFVVAIRSGLIKEDEVRFFAGCGIVEDSDPKKEWDETNLKFIPMLTALEHARR